MRSEPAAGKGMLAWTSGAASSARENAATVFRVFIRACSLDFRCILDHVSRPEECLGARRAQSIPGFCACRPYAAMLHWTLRRFFHWGIFPLSPFSVFERGFIHVIPVYTDSCDLCCHSSTCGYCRADPRAGARTDPSV